MIGMRQQEASRSSGNYVEACAQLLLGSVLPRRGRGQGHVVDKQQHIGGRSQASGSHLLDLRTPSSVIPGSFWPFDSRDTATAHCWLRVDVCSLALPWAFLPDEATSYGTAPMDGSKCKTFLQHHTLPVFSYSSSQCHPFTGLLKPPDPPYSLLCLLFFRDADDLAPKMHCKELC